MVNRDRNLVLVRGACQSFGELFDPCPQPLPGSKPITVSNQIVKKGPEVTVDLAVAAVSDVPVPRKRIHGLVDLEPVPVVEIDSGHLFRGDRCLGESVKGNSCALLKRHRPVSTSLGRTFAEHFVNTISR